MKITSGRVRNVARAVIGTGLAVGLVTSLGAASADAAAPTTYRGTVTAAAGLQIRSLPTTVGLPMSVLRRGSTVTIACKVRGTSVDGNNIWYELLPTNSEFVSARYVRNNGPAPRWCGRTDYLYATRATAAVNKRVGPSTAESIRGRLAAGARVDVVCKLRAETVARNDLWYFLTDGSWVAAAYLRNEGTIPTFCR